MFDYGVVIITASQIDEMRANGINLNEIERKGMEKIILELNPKKQLLMLLMLRLNVFRKICTKQPELM